MSLEQDPGFWKWVAGSVVTAATGVWGAFKYVDNRLEKKVDKHTYKTDMQIIRNELGHVREVQAKLFDQQRESDQRAQDRHERLMERLSEK